MGIISHFYSYKNNVGFKFHISGNDRLVDYVIAEECYGVRYSAWNAGLSIKNTDFLSMSNNVCLCKKKCAPMCTLGCLHCTTTNQKSLAWC